MGMDIETAPLNTPQNPTIDSPRSPNTIFDSRPQNPTTNSKQPFDDSRKKSLHCCLSITFYLLVLYFLCFKLIPYVFFPPYPNHPEFYVRSLKVSSLKISDNQIHGNFSLTLAADNPRNGINVRYNSPTFSIFYTRYGSWNFLAEAKIASFEQRPGKLSYIQVNLPALSVSNGASLAHAFNYDVTWRRKAQFLVELQDELSLTSGSSDQRNISLTVNCNVWVYFDIDGKSGEGQQDKIFDWCWII